MKIKSILCVLPFFLFASVVSANKNVFLSRDYWKKDPSVAVIKQAVKEGNNPSQLNLNAFDAIVYAILEDVNDASVKYLLSLEGNEIEKRTHDSRTYIFWAAYKGNLSIMRYLLAKGALINITDSHGNTPITFAAANGQKNTAVYDLFEENGVVLKEEVNKDGVNSLLLIAPHLENEKELNYFLNKGFDLNDKDPKGNNIFNHAAKKGNISFLNLLIKKGVDPLVTNEDGGNAILMASKGIKRASPNSLATYQYLEGLGITVNVIGEKGKNPLHYISSKNSDLDLLSYFIEKGVDADLQDASGNTPFMNSAKRNNIEVVKLLLENIENINLKDKEGQTALTKAVASNNEYIIDYLVKKGAQVDVIDKDGNSIVYYLLNSFELEESVEFETKLKLLERSGLKMTLKEKNGNTILHIAAEKNDLELLNRLSHYIIDVNALNNEGYTPLHIAAMKAKDLDIINYFLSIGADKGIQTEFGENVFDLAIENEKLQKQYTNLNFLK